MPIDFQDDISKYEGGYGNPDICRDLGGTIQPAMSGDEVCSEIDKIDTFCIVGSKVALPCQGLFKHVRLCNGAFNRPAWDMFFCAPKCSDDEYACGAGCERGDLAGPVHIPYVAPGYAGEVFRATLTMDHGNGRVSVLAASGFDARVYQATGEKAATVHISSPLPTVVSTGPANTEYAVTLRAGFSCAGWTQKFGTLDFAYTITALPQHATIQLTREWLAPDYFATLTLHGLGDLDYASSAPSFLDDWPARVGPDGEVTYYGQYPIYDPHILTLVATSPERSFLGAIGVTVEIRFAGPPNASRMPPDCRAPDPYAAGRARINCRPFRSCNIDGQLAAAVRAGDAPAMCALVTMGANVNYMVPGSPKPMLFGAVERGDAAMVSILAYNGADADGRFNPNRFVNNTPLHALAAYSADSTLGVVLENIAQALVENGADVDAQNAYGSTYLYLAASGGNASGMRAVLRAGADPNLPIAEETDTHRSFADFALVRAADDDRAGVVSILLEFKEESGLDVNITEELRGLGALHVAESVEVARLLARAGADVNLESAPLGAGHEAGLTPLEWQARQGRLEVAEYIHSQGGECPEDDEDLEFCP